MASERCCYNQLAVYGRLHNVAAFRAYVLADNRGMLGVLRDSGYDMVGELDHGVYEFEIATAYTEHARRADAEREKSSIATSLNPLFKPASVAVIGASRDEASVGSRLFQNLLLGGFDGPVYPVNHQAEVDVEVAMLTGDSKDVANAVASDLGIETYFAEVLPADKDKHVAQLQAGGRRVGMVGDGVNDAPALTRADIGIAIGSGTDVAVQSADLVLVKSNPLDVVKIIRLSSASYTKQLQNVWWAAGYNIVMIPLAMGILAPFGFVMPPALGAVFMSLSTIIVAVNAQLLRRVDLSA